MIKKGLLITLVLFVFIISGCSCNKNELEKENKTLKEENSKIEESLNEYKDIEQIFSFYNKITTESVNSLVVVESIKESESNKYGDGVVVGSNGYYYYVLTDYNAIYKQSIDRVSYRVMDANANVYNAEVSNEYDVISGLVLLRVNTYGIANAAMKSIDMGEMTQLVGHISSLEHINKVQLSENIKTSTIEYEDASFNVYNLDDISVTNGILLNVNNELCGFYLSNYNNFIDSNLLRVIVSTIYSLTL